MLEATFVIYIKRINKAPIKIKNKIKENQFVGVKYLDRIDTIKVWINTTNPKERGWLDKSTVIDRIILIDKKTDKISENSLYKILILEINDKVSFFWSFKRRP